MEFPDVNFLRITLVLMTLLIVVLGSLINFFEENLPVFFSQTFRYGKFGYKGKPSKLKVVEVPKSWFKHFYVFASIYSLCALYLVIDVYLYGAKVPKPILFYLDLLCGHSRKTNCDKNAVLVGLLLLTLQSFRRFYETWFVSVFSNVKINATQYMVGYIHYWATITIVVAEASGFKAGSMVAASNLNVMQIAGIALFIFAWINQYKSAKILSNLRKNQRGDVVSTEHKLPQGGLFHYLSSPHLTCEVLIYLSLYMVLYKSETFKYVFYWVFCNQMETSLLNHWWYQETFRKTYPKSRKAFIPFVL